MSSCRKSKNTKWFGLNHPNQLNLVLLFLTNSGQKSLNMLILSFLTTVQLVVFKDREIKKKIVTPPVGFKPATLSFLGYVTTAQ